MSLPCGKNIMLWKVGNCGSEEAVVNMAVQLGVDSVDLKGANGNYLWPGLEGVIAALRKARKRVGIWQYLYGGVYYDKNSGTYKSTGISPEQEAEISRQAIEKYRPDYFEIDVEKEYKRNVDGLEPKEVRAERYMYALRKGGLDIPVGLSSYRYPRIHYEIPWKNFLAGCDYVAPQVYWNPPTSEIYGPVAELRRCIAEFTPIFDNVGKSHMPIIPTGRAYIGDGYGNPGPNYEELTAFMQEAKDSKLEGCSFWAMDYLFLPTHAQNQTERIKAIAEFEWEAPAFQPTWATINTSAAYVYVRPQALSGADQPYSGILYNGKPVLKFGEIVNEKGERWAIVGGYVLDSLIKDQ